MYLENLDGSGSMIMGPPCCFPYFLVFFLFVVVLAFALFWNSRNSSNFVNFVNSRNNSSMSAASLLHKLSANGLSHRVVPCDVGLLQDSSYEC